jgi:hypothetical protein
MLAPNGENAPKQTGEGNGDGGWKNYWTENGENLKE